MCFRNKTKRPSQAEVLAFFEAEFPDSIPLIGRDRLLRDFKSNPTSPLITVKCSSIAGGRCALMGDAAHAIVPFYGQGMNAVSVVSAVVCSVAVVAVALVQTVFLVLLVDAVVTRLSLSLLLLLALFTVDFKKGFEDCLVLEECLNQEADFGASCLNG